MDFSTDLNSALHLGDTATKTFARAGVVTLGDLLLHLPLRYEDRSHLTPVRDLRNGQAALVHAQVLSSRILQGRKQMLRVLLKDAAGDPLNLLYFHFYPGQHQQFRNRRWGLFYGKASWTPQGYEMAHPEIIWLANDALPVLSDNLLAVYPTVKGLSQLRWREALANALDAITLPEHDPLTEAGYWSLGKALNLLHRPGLEEGTTELFDVHHPARKRLIIEELCAHQLALESARAKLRKLPAPALPEDSRLLADLLVQLPFQLTAAQEKVRHEIAADLARTVPMLRLVQGDVGSGKTIIALLACLQAIACERQAVFMAPTELLAEQHATNMHNLLKQLNIAPVLLASKLPAAVKRKLLAQIADGSAALVVGTHAVFQQQVCYHDLALVVVDEQHRFGVHQRLQLHNKARQGKALHQLVMTATPIPRTLAMSHYGELDTSIIDALPAGRQPVDTSVISVDKRTEVIASIGALCATGSQAYWVCPLIEESEVLECENAEATAERLREALPSLRVALIHGRLDADLRRETMAAFAAGKVDLLVATTVIEVGVDVANATLMVIENAERFGLSQLHQLRGRVGRGSERSYCLLMYQQPLGENARRRLAIMRASNDGFRIAEEDLRIRGAGELLGTRQTGVLMLHIADLERDGAFLPLVKKFTDQWRQHNPGFITTLMARWVGEKARYVSV